MESKKIVAVALVAMMLVATSADFNDGSTIDLVSDGGAEAGQDINGGGVYYEEQRGCPRILKKCRRDSDCPGGCVCKSNGYCG